ncbi:ESX secretion-associated protein EspG [Actinophytocola gossypii]|uniref:ESX secretion-associated protein EspG n=1 Tax=Actinophytocola gossypii TaxID=2812003 RepID=A0ABT2J446_9PSEU|nr:ESX secretion-associated protein EspG [Actinophytocola gossypii]MCT2582623.1 ESX secretion-associated protein EspG [Actinophytocola gossypii]
MNVELSLAALDTLWEDHGLGRVPFPLEVTVHGDTADARAGIKAAVYDDLAGRGLSTGDLADALRLLAEPAAALDLVALLDLSDDVPVRAVGALRGRHGLLAVQGARTVCLRGTRDTELAEVLVGLLPRTPAGPGSSITQPVAALRVGGHARARPGGVLRTVTPRAAADSKLRAIAAIMERPVLRAGQLGVTLVDESGRRDRAPGITWFDTDDGRYATTTTPGQDGEDWVTVWPADNARLAHRLTEAVTGGSPPSPASVSTPIRPS